MKIVDVKRKGNVVRFCLGYDDLKDWYGDDWDDRGCPDDVYDEFVHAIVDKSYPFNDLVFSPFDDYNLEEKISKDDMKNHAYPVLIVCHNVGNEWISTYGEAMAWKDKEVFYMGDNAKDVGLVSDFEY